MNDVAMASFKTQSRLLGLPVAGDSEDDDEEEEEVEEFNEAMVGRVRKRDVDSEDEEEEDSSSDDEEDDVDSSRESGAAADSQASDERARDRKRERAWLVANFIKVEKTGRGSTIYKSQLLPDKVFFSKEKLREFTDGRRYKKLIHEMRKGMRTHADNERFRLKAEGRRERREERKRTQRRDKRRVQDPSDADEIERRKAKFQAKKARRLERKAAATGDGQ